jgi:hypothetical protein
MSMGVGGQSWAGIRSEGLALDSSLDSRQVLSLRSVRLYRVAARDGDRGAAVLREACKGVRR